jgi:hypothetical protein
MCIPTQTTSVHAAIYGSLCKSPGQYDGHSQLRWSYEVFVLGVFLLAVGLLYVVAEQSTGEDWTVWYLN